MTVTKRKCETFLFECVATV